MQVSNNTHFSSDAYLISKKQYEVENKEPAQAVAVESDISKVKLEEKLYAKSVNALQSTPQVDAAKNSTVAVNNSPSEKALAAYNEVENTQSRQGSFNLIEQMV